MDKNVMINELNKLEIIGSSFFVGVGLLIFVLISLRIKNLNNTTKDEMKINRLKRTRTMTVMLSLFGQILTIIYCHMQSMPQNGRWPAEGKRVWDGAAEKSAADVLN